jgi:hypothetical protein
VQNGAEPCLARVQFNGMQTNWRSASSRKGRRSIVNASDRIPCSYRSRDRKCGRAPACSRTACCESHHARKTGNPAPWRVPIPVGHVKPSFGMRSLASADCYRESINRGSRTEYFAKYRSAVGSLQQKNDRYGDRELKQWKTHHASYRSKQQLDQNHGSYLRTSRKAGTFALAGKSQSLGGRSVRRFARIFLRLPVVSVAQLSPKRSYRIFRSTSLAD